MAKQVLDHVTWRGVSQSKHTLDILKLKRNSTKVGPSNILKPGSSKAMLLCLL